MCSPGLFFTKNLADSIQKELPVLDVFSDFYPLTPILSPKSSAVLVVWGTENDIFPMTAILYSHLKRLNKYQSKFSFILHKLMNSNLREMCRPFGP